MGFCLLEGLEFTIEANPGRLSYDYSRSLHDLGINRLSLGMQSANPGDLLLLERQHEFHQTANAVSMIRKAGFNNLNLDLIFGIPHQTLESWKLSLDQGISLNPDHLSLYALTIEPGTPMETWVVKGLLPKPDEDVSAEMYELAMELLEVHHFEQYEISNWARRDEVNGLLVCKHNIQYWRNHPYLGLGAGSHGYAGGKRTVNVLTPSEYIQKMMTWTDRKKRETLTFPVTPATESVRAIDQKEEIKETMMMGLRLTEEGISRKRFQSRFDLDLQEVYGKEIDELIDVGLLEWGNTNNGNIRLTRKGRLLGNQVFRRFI